LPFVSKIVDQKVIDAIERRGFRRDGVNQFSPWIDEHGHILTELQLLDDSIDDLMAWLHPA
jgi:hypothetical protein